jgi:hypothetical protein
MDRPQPDDDSALAYVDQITDQSTLWATVDAWRHARKQMRTEDNRLVRAALAAAYQRIVGQPLRP